MVVRMSKELQALGDRIEITTLDNSKREYWESVASGKPTKKDSRATVNGRKRRVSRKQKQ